jgi:hypothetical protein
MNGGIQRYVLNNQDFKFKVKNFIISQSCDNKGENLFEFFLNNPHGFNEHDVINISDPERYNAELDFYPNLLHGNTYVMLRPRVKIGITQTRHFKWRYVDDSNDWVDMGTGGGSLTGTVDIPTPDGYVTQEIETYSDSILNSCLGNTFTINIGSHNGSIAVKESHASEWQELINPQAIPACGVYSDHSIVSSIEIADTYFRIFRFELCKSVNIFNKGWDDCGKYFFETDFGWDSMNNRWMDHLYTSPCACQEIYVDIVEDDWVTLIPDRPDDSVSSGDPCEMVKPSNPLGLYGGIGNEIIEEEEDPGILVSIKVYPHCDDLYDPVCGNKEKVLETANFNYNFEITTKVDYEHVGNIRKCLSLSCLKIWQDASFFAIHIEMDDDFDTGVGRNEKWSTSLVEDTIKDAINPILDNERVRFDPYWKNGDDDFTEINHIRYELLFLDDKQKPDTWTDELKPPQEPTCWKQLGFVDDDVKYQKMKLKKTFLRLSYYDLQNPTQYLLEHWSTVFVDINMMFSDYIYGINNISGTNYNTTPISKFKDPSTGEDTEGFRTTFHVYNPCIKNIQRIPDPDDDPTPYRKDGPMDMNYSNTADSFYIYLYDPFPLKCGNDASSEEIFNGFWDEQPNELYLKVEFNNAKTGKRHLFFNDKNKSGVDMDNVFFDQGHSAYIWTKLWVVYNKTMNKYIWYPDSENVTQDEKCKDTLVFKLYEAYVK